MHRIHPAFWRCVRPGEPSTRWAEGFRNVDAAAQSPRQNHILAALPVEDYRRLLPELECVRLPGNSTVHHAGRPHTHLYFVTQGVVSRVCVTRDGKGAEFTTTGNEGVVGMSLCLGGVSNSSQAVVIVEGFAFRLEANRLKRELAHQGALLALILRYVHSVMAETGQIVVCNRFHPLRHRLCRWLLSLLDRTLQPELPLTHDLIAILLGARREGVTQELGKLQQEGLIHCHRGHVYVLDRAGLEARACACVPIIRRAHDYLRLM